MRQQYRRKQEMPGEFWFFLDFFEVCISFTFLLSSGNSIVDV